MRTLELSTPAGLIRARLDVAPDALELRLEAESHPRPFLLTVRPRGLVPITCTHGPATWSGHDSHYAGRPEADPYAWAAGWIAAVADEPRDALEREQRMAPEYIGSLVRTRRYLHHPSAAEARRAFAHLAPLSSLFELRSLEQARRFHLDARLSVYALLADDRTGRVAQLLRTGQGALVFAAALRTSGRPDLAQASAGFVEGVVAGRRLVHGIDAMVEAWACRDRAHGHRLYDVAVHPLHRAAWEPLAADGGGLRRRQRLCIRRAQRRVAPGLLWIPPPESLVPEDIPLLRSGNTAWFRVTRSPAAPLLGRAGSIDGEVARWLSCHAADVAAAFSRAHLPAFVQDVVALSRARGLHLARGTSLQALAERVSAWRDAVRSVLGAFASSRSVPREFWSLPFPEGPDFSSSPGWDVRKLRTVLELLDEGEAMQHCVPGYAYECMAGEAQIYAATFVGERVTIRLDRASGELWHLAEVKKRGNAEPCELTWAAVQAWFLQGLAGHKRRLFREAAPW